MHDAIAFASLLFGESSTMSEEAAMLGVPSIYLYNDSTLYTKHLENDYRLMYNYSESISDQQKAIQKGLELLNKPDLKNEWQFRRHKNAF
jgi:predicted glycosyltransferase